VPGPNRFVTTLKKDFIALIYKYAHRTILHKARGRGPMKYEYTVRVFSLESLEESGVVTHPHKNIVYACRPEGSCEVHDIGMEQLENLSGLFNEMGGDRWELVQLVFHQSGIVSFWKRGLKD
jgi:hypothetical protein